MRCTKSYATLYLCGTSRDSIYNTRLKVGHTGICCSFVGYDIGYEFSICLSKTMFLCRPTAWWQPTDTDPLCRDAPYLQLLGGGEGVS